MECSFVGEAHLANILRRRNQQRIDTRIALSAITHTHVGTFLSPLFLLNAPTEKKRALSRFNCSCLLINRTSRKKIAAFCFANFLLFSLRKLNRKNLFPSSSSKLAKVNHFFFLNCHCSLLGVAFRGGGKSGIFNERKMLEKFSRLLVCVCVCVFEVFPTNFFFCVQFFLLSMRRSC